MNYRFIPDAIKLLWLLIFIFILESIFASEIDSNEFLFLRRKVGFSPRRISWVHLPDFYSQPHSESGIDLDGDAVIDLFVFLPEQKTDMIRAFLSDGSLAWEYKVDKKDQPKRELAAFALAAFDVDSDGIKEVICGTNDLRLYALDAFNGKVKNEVQLSFGCYVYSMTIADVDGSDENELIVVCAGSAEWQRGHTRILPQSRGYIYALNKNLAPIWWSAIGDVGVLFGHYVFAGDLDGDGKGEVAISELSGDFYVLDNDGKVLWTKSVDNEIAPKERQGHVDYAMMTDIDGDARNGNELVTSTGGCLYNREGQLLWTVTEDILHGQHCAVADARYYKGGNEILFFDKIGKKVLLFTSYGEKLWERGIGYRKTKSSVSEANMAVMGGFINWTGDGTKEIIAAAGEHVLIFDEYGRLIDKISAPFLLSHDGMVVNVTNDEREEYIAITEDEFFIFSNPRPHAGKDPKEAPVKLWQNFPNPFSDKTWLPYVLKERRDLRINIYDSHGRLIRAVKSGEQEPGFYIKSGEAAYWDGRNEVGEKVADGIYFYSIQEDSSVRKMVKSARFFVETTD